MPYATLLALLFATWATYLFHDSGYGLNVLLFEAPLLAVLAYQRRVRPSLLAVAAMAGTLASAVFVLLHGSVMAGWVNAISFVFLAGVLLAPELRATHHALLAGLSHVWPAQLAFLHSAGSGQIARHIPRMGGSRPLALLSIVAVVLAFTFVYQFANPHFALLMSGFWTRLSHWTELLDPWMVGTFALGLATTNLVLQQQRPMRLLARLAIHRDDLQRVRYHNPFKHLLGLRYEWRSGLLLLGLLNGLLLVVNLLDIRHVWFGFTFNGQYLRQFVHEGTWLLILSIVVGAAIVLWYFRGNQNFFSKSAPLRYLAYLWLAQNVVLAISVAIRNFWYIHHYALAYKRIGVLFFLVAVVVGLVLVGLKVRHARTWYYLMRGNALSVYLILLGMAAVDWDVVIARYNFRKQEQAFVHLDFMATLADKALPWLAQEQHALERIDSHNKGMLDSGSFSRDLYMAPRTYGEIIAERTGRFLDTYPRNSWKGWNMAEARAYEMLVQQ